MRQYTREVYARPAPTDFEWLSALEGWVERGCAPAALEARPSPQQSKRGIRGTQTLVRHR